MNRLRQTDLREMGYWVQGRHDKSAVPVTKTGDGAARRRPVFLRNRYESKKPSCLLCSSAQATLTFPPKVSDVNLGTIGDQREIYLNSLPPMALERINHGFSYRNPPVIMNGRSILAVTSP